MNDRLGNGPSRGRMQQAVDAWEKAARESGTGSEDKPESPAAAPAGETPPPVPEARFAAPEAARPEAAKPAPPPQPRPVAAEKPPKPASVRAVRAPSAPEEQGASDEPSETARGQGAVLNRLVTRFTLCLLLALALLCLAAAPYTGVALPLFLDPSGSKGSAVLYLSLSLSLLFIEGAVGFSVAFLGIASLFTLRKDVDSIASLAYYASLLAMSLALPSGNVAYAGFGASAGLCLAFNFLGKIFHVVRVRQALRVKEKLEDGDFQAAAVVEPEASALVMRPFKGTPAIVTQLKGKAADADAEALYAPTPADAAGRVLGVTALLAALFAAAAAYFLLRRGLAEAAGVFAAVCCVAAPPLFEMGVSVPFLRTGRILAKNGAYLEGCGEISRFGGADAVTVDAAQLFPKGSVRVLGVKSFGDTDLAASVLYAASVAAEGESPLTPALTAIFADTGSRLTLRLCREIAYEDECGLCAEVDGRKVLLGNRALLRHHGVEAPSRETELRHSESGHNVIYLAMDGALSAMFILDYEGGAEQTAALRRLHRSGVHTLVCSTDPNVTPLMMEEKFGVTALDATVLGAREMQLLGRGCPPAARAELAFATLGGLAASVYACVRLRGTFWAQAVLQTVLALAGAAFVLYTLLTGAAQPAPLQVLGYQGLCALPVLLLMLRR